jgi:ATP-dependent Lhr-like helicase
MGIASGFQPVEPAAERRGARGSFARWQVSRPSAGFWFLVPTGRAGERDALDEEENARERIRQVLQRYGVVFRELLEQELPALRWSRLFRSLRLMEFSGEVVTGRFFDGVSGLQFASPTALEALREPVRDQAVFWMNAADPASLCGLDLESLKTVLPSRLPTTHVVFQGQQIVLVSRRTAQDLEFRVPPTEPRIPEYLAFAKVLTSRDQNPLPAVHVVTVNRQPVGASPYRQGLLDAGFADDYRRMTYRARG